MTNSMVHFVHDCRCRVRTETDTQRLIYIPEALGVSRLSRCFSGFDIFLGVPVLGYEPPLLTPETGSRKRKELTKPSSRNQKGKRLNLQHMLCAYTSQALKLERREPKLCLLAELPDPSTADLLKIWGPKDSNIPELRNIP